MREGGKEGGEGGREGRRGREVVRREEGRCGREGGEGRGEGGREAFFEWSTVYHY